MTTRQPAVIAVVEDDEALRHSVSELLAAFGYRTEQYESAEQFILALPQTRATCLLLDIGLGDITGIELSRHLISAGHRFPTIFMSGSKDGAVVGQAMEQGCVAFLEKPFVPHRLIEAIVTATGPNPHFEE